MKTLCLMKKNLLLNPVMFTMSNKMESPGGSLRGILFRSQFIKKATVKASQARGSSFYLIDI
ncbi:hypothetical protein C6366_06130 [Desulfonatronum sp. SC1]|nr:hypothetical protein C6366_06130 [Desulfonatronum sp. SC1]